MPLDFVATTTESDSDARLLETFVESGSPEAFESLVQRHSPMVLGVCRRMLPQADAEDAAQAVFVLLWQKAKRLPQGALVGGWLHRTAYLVCRNAIRSRVSRIHHEQHAAAECSARSTDSSHVEHWREVRRILDDEVNRLPDKLRLPFILFHLENRSLAEVAAIAESSVPTVGTWLQRARERLAGRLRKRGVAVGAAALAALMAEYALAESTSGLFATAAAQTASGLAAGCLAKGGLATGTACSPAIALFVKASAAGGAATRAWIAALIAIALIGVPLAVLCSWPAIQTRRSADFPLLQGEWREVANEQGGGPVKALPRVEFVGTLVISGRQFQRSQILGSGQTIEGERGSFVLDDAGLPKIVDFHLWQGTAHGIYELDGDTLTLCVTKDGAPRPHDMSTAPHDGRSLTKYERVKPAP